MRIIGLLVVFWAKILCAMQGETSFPYLSGYTWAFFCDWRMLGKDYGSEPEDFPPELVQRGDTIFLDFARAEEFARDILPRLKDKVILISANYGYVADQSWPGPFAYLLENEKIAAWFVQNIDREPTEKLIPIAIGIANKHWAHGNTQLLDQYIPLSFAKRDKSIFLYVNYTPHPCRADCTAHFQKMGLSLTPVKEFGAYLADLSEAVFVVSPPGNGIDCHRTWEALLMGCIPIVKSTTVDPLFEDLPVVIVKEWSEVTLSFLEEKAEELRGQLWRQDKLYAHYWFKKVRDLQGKLRAQSKTGGRGK